MASMTGTHQHTSKDEEYQKYVQQPENPPSLEEPNTANISEIVQNYEKMFAHRFTLDDEEYQKYFQRPADMPPLIEDWRNRSGGNQRYQDRFRDNRQFKGRGDRYDWRGGYRANQRQERGWGNNYSQQSQGQISPPQRGRLPQCGYGSHSQGPPYGYY